MGCGIEPRKIRKLVAVFAADVEGYSRLMGADEVGTLKGLTGWRAILGRMGDGAAGESLQGRKAEMAAAYDYRQRRSRPHFWPGNQSSRLASLRYIARSSKAGPSPRLSLVLMSGPRTSDVPRPA